MAKEYIAAASPLCKRRRFFVCLICHLAVDLPNVSLRYSMSVSQKHHIKEETPMKRFLLMILILAALALNLTGCADNAETFAKYVREGNYADAITLFQEKIMDDTQDYESCRQMLESYLDETIAAYAQGDLSRLKAEEVLNTMEMLEDYLYLVGGLEEGYTRFSDLRESKSDFHQAERYREEGQLERALEAYSEVLPEDVQFFSTARENAESLRQQMADSCHAAVVDAYERRDYPAFFRAYREAERSPYAGGFYLYSE